MEMEYRSSKRKRRTHWGKDAQHLLLNLWAQNIGALRVARKNGHILIKMAEDMEEMGHTYTPAEVKSKIHNLSNQYRDEKKKMATLGARTSEWVLYDRVHSILGGFNMDDTTSEYADDYSYSSDQHSVTKSEEFEDPHIEISDDDEKVDYYDDDADEAVEPPSTSRQSKNIDCLEAINRNVVKVIQKIDFMNKQNFVAQKRMIKVEKERNELLRELLNVFKSNSQEVQDRLSGSNASSGEQNKPKMTQTEIANVDGKQSKLATSRKRTCSKEDYDPFENNNMDEIFKNNSDPLTDGTC